MSNFSVIIAGNKHLKYGGAVSQLIKDASQNKDSGLAQRSPEYITSKITEGKAVIALSENDEVIGFCYVESWGHSKFVANSGLIVSGLYRGKGLAKQIKAKAFELSRKKFPDAKLFGLTTSLAVMKINSGLGYKPVTFTELTNDDAFWKGCSTCANYDILQRTGRVHCLCTGMLYDPEKEEKTQDKSGKSKIKPLKVYGRWLRLKRNILRKSKKMKKAAILVIAFLCQI